MRKRNSSINTKSDISNMRGFSMLELLIVLAIVSIMSSVTVFYLVAHQELYEADDQALQIIDVFQEARQRSLTQRETMRVEIDITDNIVRLIDENRPGDVSDDSVIRSIPLLVKEKVEISKRADDITENPPEPVPVPSAQFRQSIYPESLNNQVSTVRFQSNGSILDAGTNASGSTGAVNIGITLHVWSHADEADGNMKVARAITVLGSTGSIRLWEYNPNPAPGYNYWQDSRRTSVYGGTGGGGASPTP